jgi:hypothetical protein
MRKFLFGLLFFVCTLAGAQAPGIWTQKPAYPQNLNISNITTGSIATSILFQGTPVNPSGANYTQLVTDNFIISASAAGQTITLLVAASYPGRTLWIKNTTAFAVISASSNVVPLAGGAASTPILAAGPGKWAMLVSDGIAWNILAAN